VHILSGIPNFRATFSYSLELDCVIRGRLQEEIVQILHKIRLEREGGEDPIG
jgi:hypothetical protein